MFPVAKMRFEVALVVYKSRIAVRRGYHGVRIDFKDLDSLFLFFPLNPYSLLEGACCSDRQFGADGIFSHVERWHRRPSQTMATFDLAGRKLRVAWAQDQSKPALSVLPPGLTPAAVAAQAAVAAAKAAQSAAQVAAAAAARMTASGQLQVKYEQYSPTAAIMLSRA